jgi:hypothetical protein
MYGGGGEGVCSDKGHGVKGIGVCLSFNLFWVCFVVRSTTGIHTFVRYLSLLMSVYLNYKFDCIYYLFFVFNMQDF